MIFGFKQKMTPLLDDDSVAWMLDLFQWASTTFSTQYFTGKTALIYPNNEHFPGTENSVEGMAALIFSQVKTYTGIESIPCELQNEDGISYAPQTEPNPTEMAELNNNEKLIFTYHSHTLNNPEVLIASLVHQIAYYIVTTTTSPPPGGKENFPHAAELLATVMGFGLIMANTANTQKIRSCGSCSGPAVERESFLSQYDMTYALAIFCSLQNIPVKEVTFHLKKSLHTFYKKSCKEMKANTFYGNDKLQSLQGVYLSQQQNIKGQ